MKLAKQLYYCVINVKANKALKQQYVNIINIVGMN